MRHMLTIAQETVLLLRRDYIFLPLVLVTMAIIWFAKTAGLWSVYEHHKFLFDICFGTLHLSGSLAAIFWSTKLFSESRQDGSLEMLLAAPVGRVSVLLGRFLGMALVLALYCLISTIVIQVMTKFFFGWGWLNPRELLTVLFYFEVWLVIAAVGVMFAAMGSQTTAFFSTGIAWFVGLTSGGFALALTKEESPIAREFVGFVAKIWNLQNMNLAQFVGMEMFPSPQELWMRCLYGVAVILITLTIGAMFFNSRDVVA